MPSHSIVPPSPSPFSLAVPPSVVEPGKGHWVMSVDPLTNAPVYFNTVTGATSNKDPVGDTSAPGGVLGAGLTAWTPKDSDALEKLVPVVHNMADIYKSYLLGMSGEVISSEKDPELPPVEANEGPQTSLKFVPSARFVGERSGFLFKSGPQGLGYYEDRTRRSTPSPDGKEQSGKEQNGRSAIPAESVVNIQLRSEEHYDETVPRIGEWEEVDPSESKFGSYSTEEDREKEKSNKLGNRELRSFAILGGRSPCILMCQYLHYR